MSTIPSGNSSTTNYHEKADPERDSAKRLVDSLTPWRYSVQQGPILEIGAGSGIFTQHLSQLFPKRNIEVTDKSESMLHQSKKNMDVEGVDDVSFSLLDAETDEIENKKYALICGNHVAHQFKNPAITLEKIALGLTIDGFMLMSFPGEDSFQEWRSTCVDLGIPYTGKAMPGTESLVIHLSMGPVQVDFYEDQSTWFFKNFEAFNSHMSQGGMHIEQEERQLSGSEIKLLNENWTITGQNGSLGFTYHNVFMAVKRIGD